MLVAGSRLYVQESVYDQVVEGVAEQARNIKVGNGLDESTMMGPLVSSEQFDRVTGYISSGRDEGANIIGGGYKESGWGREMGQAVFNNYMETKTVITDLS